NTPAITKQQQTVRIGDGVTLLDTPGMLWPKVENPNSGLRLGVVGSVKETATDDADLGFFAAGYLRQHYPERLAQRYELEAVPGTDLETVESIGRRRGCIGRGNLVDIDRAARILVMDIRSGALGRVTFETPAIMSD
ncbi:MAG: ribosome biogenesis GTPase YlqF, partial [Planctomycetota bacterium]